MKLVSTVLIMALSFALNAQVIVKGEEWIQIKNGKKKVVDIAKMDDTHLYIIQPDDPEQKVSKVPRTVIEEYHAHEIWTIPFNFNEEEQIEYSEVVKVEGVSKDELYNKARLWFAETFKSSKDVLELDDREGGIMVGTGWSEFTNDGIGARQLWVTIKIQCKENRFKYTIYNIKQKINPSKYVPRGLDERVEDARLETHRSKIGKSEQRFRKNILLRLQAYCDDIEESISKTSSEDDNW